MAWHLPSSLAFVATLAALLTSSTAFAARIVSFDPPNSDDTYAMALNSSGAVVGFFDIRLGNQHAFLRTPNGTITRLRRVSTRTSLLHSVCASRVQGVFDSRGPRVSGVRAIRHSFIRNRLLGRLHGPLRSPGIAGWLRGFRASCRCLPYNLSRKFPEIAAERRKFPVRFLTGSR